MSDIYGYIKDLDNPVMIVAEMAWAHDGCIKKAKKIIKGAAEAKANAINLHVTSLQNYMVEHYGSGEGKISNTLTEKSSVYKYLESINLSFESFKELSEYARMQLLMVSVMCNDFESLEYVTREIKPDLLMIHPSCLTDDDFVRAVSSHLTPVLLYCGGLLLGEIERAIMICKEVGNDKIILQHGFQSYPTLVEDNHLKYLRTLRDTFGFPVAFGDHTDGDNPFSLIVPLLAIPYEVRIIEKHITFDRAEKGEDYESAIDLSSFKTFVEYVRLSEKTLGCTSWRPLSKREQKYRQVVMKKAVTKSHIQVGDYISSEKISYKRSDDGLFPNEIQNILGKFKFNKSMEKDMPIRWEDIA